MLKNKTKIVAILLALFVIFSFTFSLAVNEEDARTVDPTSQDEAVTTSDDPMLISTDTENGTVENQATETTTEMKSEDVYLTGDNVVVDYNVDGNLFVIANTVTITSQVGGDAFVCAKDFTLDGGYIYSNLFVLAENTTINGIVYDVYGLGKDITIGNQAYVYRDLHVAAASLNIFGAVGRNAFVDCGNISFVSSEENASTANGVIYGNLNYSASSELQGLENYVEGNVSFTLQEVSNTTTVGDVILSIATKLVFLLLIWLLVKWIKPSVIETSKNLVQKDLGIVTAFGLLGLIFTPIACFILILLNVTSSFAMLLATVYGLFIALSSVAFIIAMSGIVSEKNNKTHNFFKDLLIVLCVGIILYLLRLIPYVGFFFGLVYFVLGFGLIVRQIIPSKKSTENKEDTKTEVIE